VVVFVLILFAGSGGLVGSLVVVDTMHVIAFGHSGGPADAAGDASRENCSKPTYVVLCYC
jgi:hypothetical protein